MSDGNLGGQRWSDGGQRLSAHCLSLLLNKSIHCRLRLDLSIELLIDNAQKGPGGFSVFVRVCVRACMRA